jgi:hypothetical protein
MTTHSSLRTPSAAPVKTETASAQPRPPESGPATAPAAALGIDAHTVLGPAARCTVREQVDQFLIYNARTDEMHLVPPTGYYVHSLCDGARTVAELEEVLAASVDAPREVLRTAVRAFLAQLLERGLVQRATASAGATT